MTEKLGDDADELKALRDRYVPRGITTAHPIVADRAQGSEVWDTSGKRYIDFVGGIGVMNVGHNHPRVMAAVREQLDRVTHTAFQVVMYESYLRLAQRICELAPGDLPKKAIFFSTGAEAVENAVKIARAATGREAIISFSGGFHGRTLLALSLTGTVNPYKQNFGPYAAEVYQAPFPFLRELRKITEKHGILLIADEIQTGFGRTGKFFAIEHSGVTPDIITVAKSLAAGFPLSAVIGRADVMDAPAPGGLGGTFAGNPVACAAGLAVLDVMRDERLPERAARIGSVVEERMRTWAAEHELVGDVRVMGAM